MKWQSDQSFWTCHDTKVETSYRFYLLRNSHIIFPTSSLPDVTPVCIRSLTDCATCRPSHCSGGQQQSWEMYKASSGPRETLDVIGRCWPWDLTKLNHGCPKKYPWMSFWQIRWIHTVWVGLNMFGPPKWSKDVTYKLFLPIGFDTWLTHLCDTHTLQNVSKFPAMNDSWYVQDHQTNQRWKKQFWSNLDHTGCVVLAW